jgi:hypothetical protein
MIGCTPMIPRKELEELVQRRLEGAIPRSEIDRLIIEITALEEGWDELDLARLDMSPEVPMQCFDCWLEDQLTHGADIRLYFKNRPALPLPAS